MNKNILHFMKIINPYIQEAQQTNKPKAQQT